MIYIKLLLPLFIFFAVGHTMFLLLHGKNEEEYFLHETIALSYGIGIGAITLGMFLSSWAGFRFDFQRISLFSLFFWCFSCWIFQRTSIHPFGKILKCFVLPFKKFSNLPRFYQFLIIILVLEVFLGFFHAIFLKPMQFYFDAMSIWGYKAKVLYIEKGIPIKFLTKPENQYAHMDYPLLIPLAECFVYMGIGEWNDLIVKIIFPLYYLSFIIIFYSYFVKRWDVKRDALIITTVLATTTLFWHHSRTGYADEPLSFYFVTGMIYLFQWMEKGKRSDLYISAILSGCAAWTKNEGLALMFIAYVVFLLFIALKKMKSFTLLHSLKHFLIYVTISGAMIAPWFIYKSIIHHIPNDVITFSSLTPANISGHLTRIPVILSYMVKFMLSYDWNHILWIAFVLFSILEWKKIIYSNLLFIWVTIVLCWGLYFSIYIITPHDIVWHLTTSLDRVLLHFAPLVVLFIGIAWGNNRQQIKKTN